MRPFPRRPFSLLSMQFSGKFDQMSAVPFCGRRPPPLLRRRNHRSDTALLPLATFIVVEFLFITRKTSEMVLFFPFWVRLYLRKIKASVFWILHSFNDSEWKIRTSSLCDEKNFIDLYLCNNGDEMKEQWLELLYHSQMNKIIDHSS